MLAISRIRLALLILPTFTISQPSHAPGRTPSTLWLLLCFGGKVLHHLTESFNARRIVHFLTEDDRRRRHANHFAVQHLVADFDEVTLVVRAVHHRHQALLPRPDDA